LIFEKLNRDDLPRLEAIYEVYKTSFPHPDEQEPFEAFLRILDLNGDREIQERFGPYIEFVLALTRQSTREIVGGLVIGVTSGPEHLQAGFASSVQTISEIRDSGSRESRNKAAGNGSLSPVVAGSRGRDRRLFRG
jgi:hypothetical protein